MIIKGESEYDAAIKRIEELWGADRGTPDGEELDTLLRVTQEYEAKHHPFYWEEPMKVQTIKTCGECKYRRGGLFDRRCGHHEITATAPAAWLPEKPIPGGVAIPPWCPLEDA